jgi:hypothetical protein
LLLVTGWDGFRFSLAIQADVVVRKVSRGESDTSSIKNLCIGAAEVRLSVRISPNGLGFLLFFLPDQKERKNRAQTKLSTRAQKTMKTRAK